MKATTCATARDERYRAIQEYIKENDSKCILLSATPYNKTYLDLSSQLRLFVEEDRDIGIRPERYLRDMRGNRISPAPPVLAANPGRIRKERLSR